MNEEDAYHHLCAYTLSHGDPAFIHQHVVDAYMAQHADENTKPIGITFALIGLYLHVERNVSGRDVQRVHMQMGREKHEWPQFSLPARRGAISAKDVFAAPAGAERDQMIDDWAASVWEAFSGNRATIESLLREHHIL